MGRRSGGVQNLGINFVPTADEYPSVSKQTSFAGDVLVLKLFSQFLGTPPFKRWRPILLPLNMD